MSSLVNTFREACGQLTHEYRDSTFDSNRRSVDHNRATKKKVFHSDMVGYCLGKAIDVAIGVSFEKINVKPFPIFSNYQVNLYIRNMATVIICNEHITIVNHSVNFSVFFKQFE